MTELQNLYISLAPQGDDLDESQFKALTYVKVPNFGMIDFWSPESGPSERGEIRVLDVPSCELSFMKGLRGQIHAFKYCVIGKDEPVLLIRAVINEYRQEPGDAQNFPEVVFSARIVGSPHSRW